MVSFIYSDSGYQPATDRRILADGSGGENSDLCDGSFVEEERLQTCEKVPWRCVSPQPCDAT